MEEIKVDKVMMGKWERMKKRCWSSGGSKEIEEIKVEKMMMEAG